MTEVNIREDREGAGLQDCRTAGCCKLNYHGQLPQSPPVSSVVSWAGKHKHFLPRETFSGGNNNKHQSTCRLIYYRDSQKDTVIGRQVQKEPVMCGINILLTPAPKYLFGRESHEEKAPCRDL